MSFWQIWWIWVLTVLGDAAVLGDQAVQHPRSHHFQHFAFLPDQEFRVADLRRPGSWRTSNPDAMNVILRVNGFDQTKGGSEFVAVLRRPSDVVRRKQFFAAADDASACSSCPPCR
jgi:hypothetical protein